MQAAVVVERHLVLFQILCLLVVILLILRFKVAEVMAVLHEAQDAQIQEAVAVADIIVPMLVVLAVLVLLLFHIHLHIKISTPLVQD